MSLERYRQFLDRVESSPGYRHEVAVVEFTEDLCRLMDEQKVTRAELARRMGTSRAYITRLLGGNANYTLATMVKLATALEGALHVHIADQRAVTRWHDEIPGQPPSSGESVPRRSRKSSAG
ncbi:MAG TPA: helix-turn-helix transcriptional regulator [Thermoanaerobaculia bacterium]|nr:helix-turn-helix transcriptional regulator [Thermoanaerobaculia bacterium]